MKKSLALLLLFIFQSSCAFVNGSAGHYQAIVGQSTYSHGIPVFSSIQSAINAAPIDPSSPYRIFIKQGIYVEKLLINKNNIHIIGENKNTTVIRFNDYAGKPVIGGNTPLGTSASATLSIEAKDIVVKNITLENDFKFLANDQLAANNPQRIKDAQAVALFVSDSSDKLRVKNVNILGNQDTLFVNGGRSWFDHVLVAGSVDFIFGAGNALFTNSEIRTIARGQVNQPYGFVTAPSTQLASEYGLTFLNCQLTRDKVVPDNSVALGRPWHPTKNFTDGRYADPQAVGKSIFINTWMDSHITAAGWYSMGGTQKDGSRKIYSPEDARFFEYNNKGSGAKLSNQRRQLTDKESKLYTPEKILGGWKPE